MGRPPLLLSHPCTLQHDTGGHPERPERMLAVEGELAARGGLGWARRESPAATREQLTRVHSPGYVAFIEECALRGGGQLDPDTPMSEGSFAAAAHAAGGAIAVVDALLEADPAPAAFSMHRPPGHHALPEQAMGFCLFNSVAVAARHALAAHGLSRVMVLDWDVHHGNGTNDIFHSDAEVLFVSIHQWPLWPPGSGAAGDVGSGCGRGYTVNLPVPPGSGDAVFGGLVDEVVVPLTEAYRPQLVLISAGYDAHHDDPLAGCTVTEAGYAGMTASMRAACRRVDAPLGVVLEGGYDLGALARSVAATLGALGDEPGPAQGPGPGAGDAGAAEIVAAARARVARHWPALAVG